MSKKTATLVSKKIKTILNCCFTNNSSLLSCSLYEIGISENVLNNLNTYSVSKLEDLYLILDSKSIIYDLEKNNKTMSKLYAAIKLFDKKQKTHPEKTQASSYVIKKAHLNATKRIKHYIDEMKKINALSFLNKKLKNIRCSPHCYNFAYKNELYTLKDIYNALDTIIIKYNCDKTRLTNLADNVSKVCRAELKKKTKKQVVLKQPSFKKYSYNYFLNMAKWTIKAPVVKKNPKFFVVTKTGFKFYVGSEQEVIIFERLNKSKEVKDIRGQDYIIKYKSHGSSNEYHPDLIIYYENGAICLYEVKPVIQMAMNDVLTKYVAMVKVAKQKGFLCVMGGVSSSTSQVKTFEEIKNRKVNNEFKNYVEETIDCNGCFERKDLIAFKNTKGLVGNGETNPLYYDLASIVINDLDHHYMYSRDGKSIHSWRIVRPRFKNKIVL